MAGLIELKPGSAPKVQEWRDVIVSRLDEVMETLRAEGVEIESWFEVLIGGKPYLL